MKQWIKDLFSNNENVSSNRIAFLLIIFAVLALIIFYVLIAIKGTIYGIPTVDILDKFNYLILGLTSSAVITKNVSKMMENKKDD